MLNWRASSALLFLEVDEQLDKRRRRHAFDAACGAQRAGAYAAQFFQLLLRDALEPDRI